MTVKDRLKSARQNLNLTLSDVEQATGISLSTISDFENGKREPRLAQLKQLGSTYRRPMSYFLEEGAEPKEIVLWRQKPTSPNAEEVRLDLVRLAEQYHNLEVWCDDYEETNLPFANGNSERFGYSQAEKIAHDFRSQFSLGERPGQSLLRILEEVCKVKVFHLPFKPIGSAACTFCSAYGAVILLNSNNVRWRRNFDLAQELFHLLTWKIFRGEDESSVEASPWEEKLAACFARNLLMPQEPLRIAIDAQRGESKSLTFADVFEVARQFDVSVEAILWQMAFVYNLPTKTAQANVEKFKEQTNFWDNRQRDTPPNRPLRFEALAAEALRKGQISTGRYAEYLGITRRQAMSHSIQESEDAKIEVAHS